MKATNCFWAYFPTCTGRTKLFAPIPASRQLAAACSSLFLPVCPKLFFRLELTTESWSSLLCPLSVIANSASEAAIPVTYLLLLFLPPSGFPPPFPAAAAQRRRRKWGERQGGGRSTFEGSKLGSVRPTAVRRNRRCL